MRYVVIALGVAVGLGVATGSTNLPTGVQDTLTAIDSVPSRTDLDLAFQNNMLPPLGTLQQIAGDPMSDVGVRLRAIHALGKYCTATPCAASDPAHVSVRGALLGAQAETAGAPLLLLRAAIETLGPMGVSTDTDVLGPLLDHDSRDIRAATARALRDLCNASAITPLRVRYAKEQTDQVRLAISEALRILDQCPVN